MLQSSGIKTALKGQWGFRTLWKSIILHATMEAQPMEWTSATIDRLHRFYERHIDRLRAELMAANRSLGSSNPEKTGLNRLTRAEFEVLLRRPGDDPEVTRLWLRRITRGHEREFPELHAEVDSRHAVADTPRIRLTRECQRRTGT
jgi:hypothetical protein